MKYSIRNILFPLCLSAFFFAKGQEQSTQIKGNIAFLPLGMINIGAEQKIAPKYTIQGDIFVSPWRRLYGFHAQLYMIHLEARYYFQEAFRNWYVGANVGTSLFEITKWNYIHTQQFQSGFNYMLGMVVGFQYPIDEQWNLDIYIGGGNSQGFYRGYEHTEQGKLRYDAAKNWNKSGEWVPYRGGIMLTYKLK